MFIKQILATNIGKINYYIKNEILFFENDLCENIGIVLEGEIHIKKYYSNGQETILKKIMPLESFGEHLIFSSFPFFPANIYCYSKESKILLVTKKELENFLIKDFSNLFNYIHMLSDYGVQLNQKVQLLSKRTIKEKLCFYLSSQTHNFKEKSLKVNSLEEIANIINCDRVSFSREFNKLLKEGILAYHSKKIILLNIEYLINTITDKIN